MSTDHIIEMCTDITHSARMRNYSMGGTDNHRQMRGVFEGFEPIEPGPITHRRTSRQGCGRARHKAR